MFRKKWALCWIAALMVMMLSLTSVAAAETGCTHVNTRSEFDATTHRIVCVDCGVTFWAEEHYALCISPGICGYCGVTYHGEEVQHGGSSYDITEVAHWVICTACNETIYEEEHYSWCDKAGVCCVCGATYMGGNVRHKDAYLSLDFDETRHWYYCTSCGASTGAVAHYASTKDPNVCGACGAKMPAKGGLKQGANGKFYYYDKNGKLDTSFSHPAYEFEGGKFIIVNGVLDTSVNGVAYLSGADFYFYANGQVQEVTQLAEYAGAWFLLANGKVNRGFTGLYRYSGALFLITNGQVRTDYTGPWVEGVITYNIVNGQVWEN